MKKAFRALEMVMAVKSMVTQIMGIETVAAAEVSSVPTVVGAQQAKDTAAAATGVANQAGGDPYTIFREWQLWLQLWPHWVL